MASTWHPLFPDHQPPEVTYRPDKGSVPSAWVGDWVGEGLLVSIARTPGEEARLAKGLLDVTVTETIGTRSRTTTTTGVAFDKDLVGRRLRPGRGRRRGEDLVLDPPPGAEVLAGGARGDRAGGLLAGDQYGGDHLVLDGDASLEMYRMVSPATPETTPAIRYRRPVSRPLRLVDPTGKDLMLQPKSNFG